MELIFDNVTYKSSLKKFSYTFEEGKITSIITKENYTDFIYLVSRLEKKYEGKITNSYKGRNLGVLLNNKDESFIFTSVREELSFGLKKYNYKVNTIDKRIKDALKMVNLPEEYLDKNPFELSSGEKYLVSLAVVLALNPKLIIIDDINSLDNKNKEYLIKLLKKINSRYNKTIIIISSDINFISRISTNYLIMKDGKLLSSGKTKNLYNDIDKITKAKIEVPKILEFINTINKKKNIDLMPTFDIKELMKDIYRNVK